MVRIVSALAVGLFAVMPVAGANGPRGQPVRLGSDRFRAGSTIEHFAIAPGGQQFATVQSAANDQLALTLWDAATGEPLREQLIARELFQGLIWGQRGSFAVAICSKIEQGHTAVLGSPADVCVWNFADPHAELPPLIRGARGTVSRSSAQYRSFHFSADGRCMAALWQSHDGRFAVYVYAFQPGAHAARLERLSVIDLGAEEADAVRISADGETVVTFRELANPEKPGCRDYTATVWPVRRGRPAARPVRISTTAAAAASPLLDLTPDGRAIFVLVHDGEQWGLDQVPLVMKWKDFSSEPRRKIVRWPNEKWPCDGRFAFAASGNRLALAVERQTFLVDSETGQELGRLEGHAGRVVHVAIAAEGQRIATADEFGLVRVWDAASLRPVHELPHHRAPVDHAELSPDGRRLLTWSRDATVRLWDIATGTELRAFTSTSGKPSIREVHDRPTFTPDGTAVVLRTAKRLIARDWQTGLEVPLPGELAHAPPHLAVFDPRGHAVLTWSDQESTITVYDWPSGKKRFVVKPDGPPQPARFSADGSVVFTDNRTGSRWDAQTGQELPPGDHGHPPDALWPLVGLRSHLVPVLYTLRGQAPQVLEAGSEKPLSQFHVLAPREKLLPFARTGMAIAPSGGQFAAALERERLVVLGEMASGQIRRQLRGHRGAIRVLGFTPDGSKLLTAGGDHTVLVWDVQLTNAPLTEPFKQETSAVKLWELLATGNAPEAYLAMARLAREPAAAVQMARMKLRPGTPSGRDSAAAQRADARAIELLESLGTPEAIQLLNELAHGDKTAFRTQEAQRALHRLEIARKTRHN